MFFETGNGRPVLLGSIKFNPDRAKGQTGFRGGAEIRDGRSQTNPEMGPGLGPHIALLTGYEPGEVGPDAKPLFVDCPASVEITADSRVGDFGVPGQGKKSTESGTRGPSPAAPPLNSQQAIVRVVPADDSEDVKFTDKLCRSPCSPTSPRLQF